MTPEQRAAMDRAKNPPQGWFGRVPIAPAGEHERSSKIVPVHGRVVRR